MTAGPLHAAIDAPATRGADPVPYLAQLTPFGTPHGEHAETISDERKAAMQTQPGAEKPAGPALGKRAADFVGKSMAAMKVGIAETAESFRENLKEYKKRAQVRSAEAHASRVARMLDLEQRQAEAQERSRELEIAREAAAARLSELLRERDPGLREEGLRQEKLREEMLYEASKPVTDPADASPRRKPAEALRHASIAGLMTKPRRPMSPQLRAVLTGAAAVTFLFVIGIALGVLQPHAPLANTSSHPASSSNGAAAPNNGVTLQPGGVTVKTGTPGAQPQAKSSQSHPGAPPMVQAATPAKPSPGSSTSRRIAQENGENELGDDVVVRHYNTPAPTEKPKQSGQQAGLKHFSDIDNQ